MNNFIVPQPLEYTTFIFVFYLTITSSRWEEAFFLTKAICKTSYKPQNAQSKQSFQFEIVLATEFYAIILSEPILTSN